MKKISKKLLQARRDGKPALLHVSNLPESEAAAYVVSLEQMTEIAAWKIGGANPWSRAVFKNTEIFFGPLHPHEVFFEGDRLSVGNLLTPVAEPEVMLEIGDLHSNCLSERFPRMGLGFEIPATVLPDNLKPHSIAQICDRGGAGALWVSAIQAFNEDVLTRRFEVSLSKNATALALGSNENVVNGPLGAAVEFLNLAARHKMPVTAGQWIATGGLCPAVPVAASDVLELDAWGCNLQLHVC